MKHLMITSSPVYIQGIIVQCMKTILFIVMQNHNIQSNCYEISDNAIGGYRLSSVNNTLMGTVSSAEFERLQDP